MGADYSLDQRHDSSVRNHPLDENLRYSLIFWAYQGTTTPSPTDGPSHESCGLNKIHTSMEIYLVSSEVYTLPQHSEALYSFWS